MSATLLIGITVGNANNSSDTAFTSTPVNIDMIIALTYYIIAGCLLLAITRFFCHLILDKPRGNYHPELYDKEGRPLSQTLYTFTPSQDTLKKQLEDIYNKDDDDDDYSMSSK